MNCQEALDLLYDIIDKEASEIDTQRVQSHLQNCHHCFEIYKVEGAVQDFIMAKLANDTTPPRLDVLKSRIMSRLDAIDEEHSKNGGRPPFWNTTFMLAVAAFVVMTIGAAYLIAGLNRHQDLYAELERAHWNVPNEHVNLSDTNVALAYAAESLEYRMDQNVSDYALASGHMENISGTRMAHFVYRQGDKMMSVFVAPAAHFSIPEDLRSTMTRRNDHDMFDHHCRSCRLVYHRDGKAIIVTADNDHTTEQLDFLPGSATI